MKRPIADFLNNEPSYEPAHPMSSTAMNREINVFCDGLDHPEGLAFALDGTLYCGGEAGQIYRISPDGKSHEIVGDTGGFNLGLAFSPEGWLAICDGRKNCIWRFNLSNASLEVWASESGGKVLGGMNFPVFDAKGNLYASENGRWGEREGIVHRFQPNGKGEAWARDFHFANGLALDVAESFLYVVQSSKDDVLRVPILSDGRAGGSEAFVSGLTHVPDGLAFDAEGSLYVCCYGDNSIWKVNARGDKELVVNDPTSLLLNRATNMAFGGPRGQTLFVANLGGYQLSALELSVTGQALAGGEMWSV